MWTCEFAVRSRQEEENAFRVRKRYDDSMSCKEACICYGQTESKQRSTDKQRANRGVERYVRYVGNFRYILIPKIINKLMTVMSDPVRAKHVQVFKLKLKRNLNNKQKHRRFSVYPKARRLTGSTGAPLSPGLVMLIVEGPCSM
jgi:hypothetical protein